MCPDNKTMLKELKTGVSIPQFGAATLIFKEKCTNFLQKDGKLKVFLHLRQAA